MKPTPGPYKIVRDEYCSYDVFAPGGLRVAEFINQECQRLGPEQARANAEAWIAGIAAVEKLTRMSSVVKSQLSCEDTYAAMVRILDE